MSAIRPWTGKKICSVPNDPRVFMTYEEYEAALAAYRATLAATPFQAQA